MTLDQNLTSEGYFRIHLPESHWPLEIGNTIQRLSGIKQMIYCFGDIHNVVDNPQKTMFNTVTGIFVYDTEDPRRYFIIKLKGSYSEHGSHLLHRGPMGNVIEIKGSIITDDLVKAVEAEYQSRQKTIIIKLST